MLGTGPVRSKPPILEHEIKPTTYIELISSVSGFSQPTLILLDGPGGSGKTNILRRMEKVYELGSTSSESRPVCVQWNP